MTRPPAHPTNRFHRLVILVVAGLALATSTVPASARQAGGGESLFGSHEVRSTRMSLFPKWQGALARYFDESRLPDAPCTSTVFNRCHLREWKRFLHGLRGERPAAQIKLVNEFMNRHRYVIDPRNYGVPDYWATPRQFLTLDGDCEDYAIAKYLSLRALGFDPVKMRIVVLQDLNLGAAHAVLVVYHGGRALVLDNQIKTVIDHAAIHHYRPIYSINEQAWWLHRM